MTIAVFDIDGVVADVRHRLHHLEGHRAWLRFFDDADDDPLLAEGAALVAEQAGEHDIVWLSGRPEWLRELTTGWLARNGLPHEEVHLRPDGDYRPARRYKLEVLLRLAPRDIAVLVDDDPEVVDAASGAGLPTVLAEWVPRGDTLRAAQERWGRT